MAKKKAASRSAGAAKEKGVDALMRGLEHPHAEDIGIVRAEILRVDPSISEEVKWNAPSFRTHEFFATVNLRSKDGVQLVMHRGAKARTGATQMQIDDPEGLLSWLGTDRCLLTLGTGSKLRGRLGALRAIVRAWIERM